MSAILHDPPSSKVESISVPVNVEEVIQDHYQPMFNFLATTDQSERIKAKGIQFTIARIPDSDDFLGVATELFRSKRTAGAAKELSRVIEPLSDDLLSIGRDGTYLRLGAGWGTQDMVLGPQDRSA